jgi:hypothetical protein
MQEAPPINVTKSPEGRARMRAKAASGVRLRTASPVEAAREAQRIAAKARAARRRPS